MTIGGWIWMVVSLGFVWGLVIWAYRKVLTSPAEEKTPSGLGP
jgi:hypothetical protein